ncbi:uncharacterized protein SCHCODRAFT_01092882 [Schizophyllum commune H4-8]|uniref:uncharacterized protein n=1 Tax=Schizophyllum commune (strain H4-8 / FGSC 9210) TaxID=578458 RepID=UPI0021604207|nr:uncharacterized protein SCHCODRAFT_01092882 [Schizophyllum commune H4-8]KAI5896184.1 hypothetical protein SCHCODRAFT_01092882 [Schizophyllum commune H4-8]
MTTSELQYLPQETTLNLLVDSAPVHLFPELWSIVFAKADRDSACQLAASSSALRRLGLPNLFKNITIEDDDKRSLHALRSILPMACTVELRDLHCSLTMMLFISTLPRLRTLIFAPGIDLDAPGDDHLALVLWLHAAPRLRYLTLDLARMHRRDLVSALLLVPRLRKLVVINGRTWTIGGAVVGCPSCSWPELEELIFREGVELAFVEGLTPGNHFPALKTLRLIDYFLLPPPSSLDRLLAASQSTLSHLHVDLPVALIMMGPVGYPLDSMTRMVPLTCNISLPSLRHLRVLLNGDRANRSGQLRTVERLTLGLTLLAKAPIRLLTLEVKVAVGVNKTLAAAPSRKYDRWQDESLPAQCNIELLLTVRELSTSDMLVAGPPRNWPDAVCETVRYRMQKCAGITPVVALSFVECDASTRLQTWRCHSRSLDTYPSRRELGTWFNDGVEDESEEEQPDYETIRIVDYFPSLDYRNVAVG